MGAEIGVAQSIGRKNHAETKSYTTHTIQIGIVLSLFYGTCLFFFRNSLMGFFNIEDTTVVEMALSYLVIIAMGILFFFINPILTGILNGYGNSKTPFIINAVGLVTNLILDPLLILGIGPFPALGVKGAAIATIGSQALVTIIFMVFFVYKTELFADFHILQKPDKKRIKAIFKLGLPVAIQSGLFTIFSMVIARIISNWGPTPIAVQRIGSQIEAISWMTAGGFATALSTFIGQNYGAKKWQRIYKGYYASVGIITIIGIGATLLLIFGARPIFSIFINEKEAIDQGVVYLRILGLSQLFMCIEIISAGAFNGIGKTIPPSFVGVLFNGIRIPASMWLSSIAALGLTGVWWSISITSIFKGVVLTIWFIIFLEKHPVIRQKRVSI
jgi:Na+-driven multidrug efflux pump